MKNYIKYLCAALLVIGTCAHVWGADPAAPSARYSLIKSTSSLSVNDRVILYSPNGTAISGLSTCSTTDARVSSTQSEWVEYKVTAISGSTIKLQDTRVSGTNSYAYDNSNKFQYTSSGSATAFTLASSGLLSNGSKTLGPVSIGTGDCARNSARFNGNPNGYYVFKVVGNYIKNYYYSVTATTAELTINADVSSGSYESAELATVHIDGTHFVGAVYAELIWPTWGADDYYGYTANHQYASNGFVCAFKGSTYSPNNDEPITATIFNTVPDGTYNAQLHFYPKDGSTVTDPPYEYYIPVKIVVTGAATCDENPTFITAGTPTTTSSLTSTSVTINNSGLSSIGASPCAIESYGYCWSTSEHPTTSSSHYQKGTTISASTSFGNYTISGLNPNTTYYLRPYATNGHGTAYGPEVSITTLQRYTITYNKNDGGSTTDTQYKDHGVNATLKGNATFSRTGYTLSRWDTNSGGTGTSYDCGGTYTGNANLTLYAIWAAKTYTISLDGNGGTGNTSSVTATYNSATLSSSITNPTQSGYTFQGWYSGSGGTGTLIINTSGVLQAGTSYTGAGGIWTNDGNVTLYAKWSANVISLTLDKGTGGTSGGSGSVTFDGTSATISTAATKTGDYTLLGYYAAADGDLKVLNPNGTFAGSNVTGYITSGKWSNATSPTTLYAHWADVVYTISFDLNGHGSGTPADQAVVSGSYASEPTPAPTDPDYNLEGWYTEAGCETKWNFSSNAVTSSRTLYANWVSKEYERRIFACVDFSVASADAGMALVTSRNGVNVMATNPIKVTVTGAITGHAVAFTSEAGLKFYKKVDGLYKDLSVTANMLRAPLDNAEVYVSYNPTSAGDGSILTNLPFTITCDGNSQEFNTGGEYIKARNLPDAVAIAAKIGDTYHALPANMTTATNPAPEMVTARVVDGVLKAEGPSTIQYKLWPVATIASENDRFGTNASASVAYGDRLRFGGNSDKGLWANNSSSANTIKNDGAIDAVSKRFADNDEHYEWAVTTREVDGQFVYTLATDQSNNTNKLRLWGHKWGTYADGNGVEDLYILPLTTITKAEIVPMEWGTNMIAVQYTNGGNCSAMTASIGGASPTTVTMTSLGGDIYKLTGVGDLQSNPAKTLTLAVTESSIAKQAVLQLPLIVTDVKTEAELSSYAAGGDGSTRITEGRAIAKGLDVIIRDGGKLTTGTASGSFADMYIYPGGKANITNDFKATKIYMRGGYSFLNSPISGTFKYPDMFVDGATITTDSVIYDLFADNRLYYTFSMPYEVPLGDVHDETGSDAFSVWVKHYDGALRATGQNVNGWAWYGDEAGQESFFAGVGYEITAKPRVSGRPLAIIRYPVKSGNITSDAGNAPKVDVGNWGYAAWEAGTQTSNNVGWNLLGNPYFTEYKATTDTAMSVTGDLVKTIVDGNWDGTYHWDTKPIRFITVPYDLATDYHHERVKDYAIPAFSAFFIQTSTAGKFTMGGTRTQAAASPAHFRKEQAEEAEICVDLLLNGDEESVEGKAGLIIHDQYEGGYSDFEDVEQWFGSANLLKTYTVVEGMALAYNLLDKQTATTLIPVGYVANVEGMHTYSISEQSDLSRLEHVWLTDLTENITTDLLVSNYEFNTEAGRNDERFAISVTFKQEGSLTDINNTDVHDWANGIGIFRDGNTLTLRGLPENSIVYIYDMVGKLLVHKANQNTVASFNVATQGVYNIRVISDGKAVTLRTIIR